MGIDLLLRLFFWCCSVEFCSEQSLLWGDVILPLSLPTSAHILVALLARSPIQGLGFLRAALRYTATCIHPSAHPTALLRGFSLRTAQPLPQTLSSRMLPPSLISTQPSATGNKQNVWFLQGHYLLTGCSLQTPPAS